MVRYSMTNDNASHILLIPFISAWFLLAERREIFREVHYDYTLAGLLLAISAVVCYWTTRSHISWKEADLLAGYGLAMVLVWIAGFGLFFGKTALQKARFSMLFLFLAIPLPDSLLNHTIYILQKGSADVAEMIFDLAGVPALREGFVFRVPHFTIEVAQECSGIRSSLALLVLALIAAHLFLRTFWKQIVFVVAGLLIMVVKNGVRIATLTILAEYVNPGFLYGSLHHQGGVVFFLVGLVLLFPILWLLQRGEKTVGKVANSPTG